MLHPSSAPRSRTLAAALALSLVFHLALLVAIAYHAFTWFKLFPLTMPPVVVGGKKVAPDVIVRSGFTAAIVCAVGLLAVVWRIAA